MKTARKGGPIPRALSSSPRAQVRELREGGTGWLPSQWAVGSAFSLRAFLARVLSGTGGFARTLALFLALASFALAPAVVCAAPASDPEVDFATLHHRPSMRRPLDLMPFWCNALKRDRENPVFTDDKVLVRNRTWSDLRNDARGKTGMPLLRVVNAFWNRLPYVEDRDNWGREDYWAAPYEFVKKSGDCEDYAIAKYLTLRELGVPAVNMRVLVVKDVLRRAGHAVLAVDFGGTIYILDNVSDVILDWDKLSQYVPQYAVNENGAWMYMPVVRKADRTKRAQKMGHEATASK